MMATILIYCKTLGKTLEVPIDATTCPHCFKKLTNIGWCMVEE